MADESNLDSVQPSENPGRGIADTRSSFDRARDSISDALNRGSDDDDGGSSSGGSSRSDRAREAFRERRERARRTANVDDPTVSQLGAFEPDELTFDVGDDSVTVRPTQAAAQERQSEVRSQRVGGGDTDTQQRTSTRTGTRERLGTIADARVPGTDSTVLETLDRADRSFRRNIVDPLTSTARDIGEADTMLGAGGVSTQGSEQRGQLFADFTRTAASGANVPGFAGDALRLGPRAARLQGDPEGAREAAEAGAQLGREGAAFAQENPARAGAIFAGGLAGAGIATGTARATRAGARRAADADLPTGGAIRRELDEFGEADRAQVQIGRQRDRGGDDVITGDDIAGTDDFDPQRVTRAEVTRARETSTRRGAADFSNPWTRGRRSARRGRGDPDDFRRPVEDEAMAQDRVFEGLDDTDTSVPRDPLDTSGGQTPAGGGLFNVGDLGIGAGAATSGFLGQQTDAGAFVEEGAGAALEADLAAQLGLDVGTGFDTGTGVGDGTTTDPLTGTGLDDDTVAQLGIEARTTLGSLQAVDTEQLLDTTVDDDTVADPTQADPTGRPAQPGPGPGGRPFRPPRIPELEGDDSEEEPLFGTDADDELFASGIADADDILGGDDFRL